MADFIQFPWILGIPVMEFTDRSLKCIDCGAEFVFTAGEQLFFHDKQFKNDPKHCKRCKAKRVRSGPRVRSETRTTCSQCAAQTTVPFKPTQGRPVLCRQCFQLKRVPSAVAAVATMDSPAGQIAVAAEALAAANPGAVVAMTNDAASAATVEMIAKVPAEAIGEMASAAPVEMMAAAESAEA